MDLIGEIVEKEIDVPREFTTEKIPTGFPAPDLLKKKRALRFKTSINDKAVQNSSQKTEPHQRRKTEEPLLEAQKIHHENLEKIASMTDAEIMEEQQELLRGLDPHLIKSLLKRSEERSDSHKGHTHAEGYDGWIGGPRNENKTDLGHLDDDDVDRALGVKTGLGGETQKSVAFSEDIKYHEHESGEAGPGALEKWEDVDDVRELSVNPDAAMDRVAPEEYQLLSEADDEAAKIEPEVSGVHFPKPAAKDDDLDLDDPDFYNKLHQKYYPDLPKETSKLSWMTTPVPHTVHTTYESVSDIRFDFQGNIVELPDTEDAIDKIPTHLGLHHHSDNPNLAGYTLPELAHLARSVVPGQRSISIRTLGRILHKLGVHKYKIGGSESGEVNRQFEQMMWSVIQELRVIETLSEAADEARTRSLSVRNYALEALWLWRQGGGQGKMEREHEEDGVAEYIS